ncbi:hypothetical protein AAVH_03284 [Aphelenchoides avenae]|nr:hypothetical protein AAVH_03284 [Aphelenchus avenae]
MTPQPRGLFVTRHLPASASPPTFNSSLCAHYAKVGQYFSDAGSRHAANGGDILLMLSDGSYALVHSVLAGAHSAFFRRFVVEDRVPTALDLSCFPQCEAIRLAVRYMYEGYVRADAALLDDLQFIARLWEIDGLQELLQNEPSNSDQAFACSPHFARQFMRAARTSEHVKPNHAEFPTTAVVRRSSETAVDVPPNQSELPKKASFKDHQVDDARRTPQEDSLYDIRNIPDPFVNDAKQTAPPKPLSMVNSEHSQRTDIGSPWGTPPIPRPVADGALRCSVSLGIFQQELLEDSAGQGRNLALRLAVESASQHCVSFSKYGYGRSLLLLVP